MFWCFFWKWLGMAPNPWLKCTEGMEVSQHTWIWSISRGGCRGGNCEHLSICMRQKADVVGITTFANGMWRKTRQKLCNRGLHTDCELAGCTSARDGLQPHTCTQPKESSEELMGTLWFEKNRQDNWLSNNLFPLGNAALLLPGMLGANVPKILFGWDLAKCMTLHLCNILPCQVGCKG